VCSCLGDGMKVKGFDKLIEMLDMNCISDWRRIEERTSPRELG